MLLLLLMDQEADVARLISTLARVQGISAYRLAEKCGVQKSALLRFCKGQQGGYLSEEVRERVLAELGWEKEGLSPARVHTWKIADLDDAQFLFGIALQGRAKVSFLRVEGSSQLRIGVAVAGDAPIIVSATYGIPPKKDDPMISKSAGPYRPAAGLFADLRVLEAVGHTPKSFFKFFRKQPVFQPGQVGTSLPDDPALGRLANLGFEESEIDALVEDFLSMQCRVNPLAMRERLKAQWKGQEIWHSSPDRPGLAAAMEGAVDTYLGERAARPYKYNWGS